ncbi:unnamed protein product [Pieris brassicae]|uniref:Uncharacterized protein n=1 Tax=Pieris brassicae TaxID=7116 RepID=A0A9P0XKU5_PIEBR|nr:unnamed protein product [Pieris brassicae]
MVMSNAENLVISKLDKKQLTKSPTSLRTFSVVRNVLAALSSMVDNHANHIGERKRLTDIIKPSRFLNPTQLTEKSSFFCVHHQL